MEKKEFNARPVNNNTHLWELYYENGGEVPQELSGMYTSKSEALTAGKKYIEKRDAKKSKVEK